MGLWKTLFGGRASPTVDPWEVLKQQAKERARQQRESIEAQPRMRPAEISSRISQLRTIDGAYQSYSKMRRADFCDVIAGAVKAGNFSEDDASTALHLREWVRSGGDVKLSFPEWLEAEGSAHFLDLNRQWLASGDRNISFNDWLAKQEPMEGRMLEDEREEVDGEKKIAPEPKVLMTPWWVKEYEDSEQKTLIRTFEFSGVNTPKGTATLTLKASVDRFRSGKLDLAFSFELSPYKYLNLPGLLPSEKGMSKPPFAVAFIADGKGAGTEASPLVRGAMGIVVMAGVIEDEDMIYMKVQETADVMQCCKTIATGASLNFSVLDYDNTPPVKSPLRIPNDSEFERLYRKLLQSV